MLWRHLCRVRAWSAAGLLTCTFLGAPVGAEPAEPIPGADAAATEAVSVLDARKAGDLTVDARGAGQDRVKMTLKNTSGKRLKVVLPPGLVASSAAGQAGGRGGFQSMGLGSVSNRPGSFGAFAASDSGGPAFRSVGVKPVEPADAVTLPAGQAVELTVVSVCLNFGVRTPGLKDRFELMDVDDYTTDPRARKALRTLATYGTGQGVAQAVMWKVCNDLPFEAMGTVANRVMNAHEVALASRFVEALDASGSSELVDPAYLTERRLFVRVAADGANADDARRLAQEVEGMKVLGLPVRLIAADDTGAVEGPAVLLNVVLSATPSGQTRGRVAVSRAGDAGQWCPLGKTAFQENAALKILDGAGLARALDGAVASGFVTVKTVRRSSGSTQVRIENRLPFTLANVSLKAGHSAGAPTVPFTGLGIGPARSAVVAVQAPGASIEHVEMNGL